MALDSIDFHGSPVTVYNDERGAWIVQGQACLLMGIDVHGQQQLLGRKAWSEGWTCVIHAQLPGDTQSRDHFMLHQRRVPMWIANIDTSRMKDPAVRATVETWQNEFADVLADYVEKGYVLPQTGHTATHRAFAKYFMECVEYPHIQRTGALRASRWYASLVRGQELIGVGCTFSVKSKRMMTRLFDEKPWTPQALLAVGANGFVTEQYILAASELDDQWSDDPQFVDCLKVSAKTLAFLSGIPKSYDYRAYERAFVEELKYRGLDVLPPRTNGIKNVNRQAIASC